MTTTLLLAASDVTVRQDHPTTNWAGYPYLTIMDATGEHRYGLLYFNLPFPRGVTILSATLRLYQRGPALGGSRTLTARRLLTSYSESKVTWSNVPGSGTTTGSSAAQGDSSTNGREWALDVTDIMQLVSDGEDWYGFRITSDNDTLFAIHSREASNTAWAPVLEVEYSDAPGQPSELSPSNGRAVSIARPTLRWDFHDVVGNTNMSAFQVQLNEDAPDAVSPDVDSGEVAASLPQYTLGFDVTAAEVWYWRVRNKDGAGLWSEWSDWVSFTRTAKPTLTITAPSSTVFEATPTFAWTFTGQTAYQAFVVDGDVPTRVLYEFSKVTSTDTSVTMPSDPVVLVPGGSYQLVVRAWDGVAREGTPGDPAYTEAVEPFTFGLSNTVDPVDTLTVTSGGSSPWIDVAWTRAVEPDSYALMVDGAVVLTGIDSADTSLRYYGASPRADHEVSILAVEGGVSSDDNPSDTVTLAVKGIWLILGDGSAILNLAHYDDDPVGVGPAEVSEVHSPLGATEQVVRTQATFGRTGHVSGVIDDRSGTTVAAALADWDTIIADRGNDERLYLVASDTAMRVRIFNTVRGLADEFHLEVPVDFDYIERP